METILLILTPLAFYLSWSVFTFSSKAAISLVALLFSTLGAPLLYMSYIKAFWPCGLFLILMTTGLMVVFAYMVSLHPQDHSGGKSAMLLAIILAMAFVTSNSLELSQKVFHPWTGVLMNPLLSFLLIFLLLFLVVAFIRNVYSKGGGFRKKF